MGLVLEVHGGWVTVQERVGSGFGSQSAREVQ